MITERRGRTQPSLRLAERTSRPLSLRDKFAGFAFHGRNMQMTYLSDIKEHLSASLFPGTADSPFRGRRRENWGGSWQESTYVLAIKSEKEVMNIHRREHFGRRRLLFNKEKSKNDSQLRMMILIHLLIIMTAKRYTCKPFLIRHRQMHTGAKVQSLQSNNNT